MQAVALYDTTLRDGTQGEQVTLSAEDKMNIARKLDEFGIPYIEGGWPGSNPKDARFFQMARKDPLQSARLAAFGSTRKPGGSAETDPNIRALLEAETGVVTVVGKSWDLHATEILGTTLDENLRMIRETVAFLKARDLEVVYDAEHFFDGYTRNLDYAMKTITAAAEGGADTIVLCDTNGGMMPHDVLAVVEKVAKTVPTALGIHCHNDCGMALANSLAAVRAGASMVQGDDQWVW